VSVKFLGAKSVINQKVRENCLCIKTRAWHPDIKSSYDSSTPILNSGPHEFFVCIDQRWYYV
jgi:hypothetical protein